MKTLIAVTGGVDSTYALWKLLATTDEEITAIHFDSDYIDVWTHRFKNLWSPRASVIQKRHLNDVIPWLQENVRPFNYITRNIDTSKYVEGKYFAEYMGEYAVENINNGTYDKFVTGHCKANEGYGSGSTSETVSKQGHYRMWELFKATANRGELSFPLFDVVYDRSVALTSLPSDLAKLVCYCDDPHFNFETETLSDCDHCTKCALKYFYNGQIASGKTTEQIIDYVNQLSTGPNGTYVPQKYWLQSEVANTAAFFVVGPRYFVENDNLSKPWQQPLWPSSYKVGQ
jgi:hypothetical protein